VDGLAVGPGRLGGLEDAGWTEADVWSPEDVRDRLDDAGRTLVALPMPKGERPQGVRSHWPETARQVEDAFFALVGADDQIKQDFSREHNAVRVAPNARAVARMEEVLIWLWYLKDERKRRLCLARALIHPVSDRRVVSYRKLGRIFGLHHDTMRAWHDRALSELAQALTHDRVRTNSSSHGRRRT
jgi:cation transport regulator ChaB